jgi:hypothetical protein
VNDQLVNELLERLDTAGELAVEGFEILLRQVYITAAFNFLWGIALFLLTGLLVVGVRRFGYLGGERVWKRENASDASFGAGSLAFVAVCTLFASLAFFQAAFTRLVNPEFHVIEYLRGEP